MRIYKNNFKIQVKTHYLSSREIKLSEVSFNIDKMDIYAELYQKRGDLPYCHCGQLTVMTE